MCLMRITDCYDTARIYLKNSARQAVANSVGPDQMPQNAASDQGLRCLLLIQLKQNGLVLNWTTRFALLAIYSAYRWMHYGNVKKKKKLSPIVDWRPLKGVTGKQCRPRSDARSASSDQSIHSLQII